MKDYADFEAWREQHERRQYQDAKNIRAQWDSMGGLNRFLTGPLWTDDSTIDATGGAAQKEVAVPTRAPRIYVASSKIRNPFYQPLIARMRAAGYEIHGWSDPPLRWEDIDPNYKDWTIARHVAELRNPASPARLHYQAYCKAIVQCDVFVLLLPAGTDAHGEAVMASMLGKPVIVCFRRRPPATRTHPLSVLAVHRRRRRADDRGGCGARRSCVLLPAKSVTHQCRGKRGGLIPMNDFMRQYEKHLNDPKVLAKRHAKIDRQIREGRAIEQRKQDHQMRAVVVANKLRDLADAIERAWSGLPQEREP